MPSNKAQDLFNVNGLVAVITGGGSGLGIYAARALDANGAKAVYIVGRREVILKNAAKTAVNGNIIPIVGDVTDSSSLVRVADQVRKEQGFINVLYANAGITGSFTAETVPSLAKGGVPSIKELQQGLLKTKVSDWENNSQVNVAAVSYTVAAFLDLLDAGNKKGNVAQDSQVLITSSIASFSRSLSVSFPYQTSKAATTSLAKAYATSFGQWGYRIRCNAIAPGFYPSELTGGMLSSFGNYKPRPGHEDDWADASAVPAVMCPALRSGSEQDFAGVVLFLTSKAGAYVNGEVLLTDGGRLAIIPATY